MCDLPKVAYIIQPPRLTAFHLRYNSSMNNFWHTLPKPFFALAPMEDVTDTVFRQIVAGRARPDVFFTEFVSVDGLVSRGRKRVEHRLRFTEIERPIVAQIWGLEPQNYYTIAKELVELGFDGVDINMGCPVKDVVKKGACAALINNSQLAAEIIQATKEGLSGKLPLSVKTRIGLNQIVTQDWIGFLLKQNLDAIAIHGRTARELSDVPAHWDEIGKAVALRNQMKVGTLIIGNGDVKDRADGLAKVKQFGVDGVMIGRGIFQNLWAFSAKQNSTEHTTLIMLNLMLKHCWLFNETWRDRKSFLILRKFFKIYISGFTGAGQWREKIMRTHSTVEVETLIQELRQSNPQMEI